jgi:hypothetical protein
VTERPLPHLVKHSPTGFGWGYAGSGAAELARCLLIHALGDNARCQACEGTGRVEGMACMACDDGVAVLPSMYQQFKFDVIAKLAENRPWTMAQSEVLAWHSGHDQQLTLGG